MSDTHFNEESDYPEENASGNEDFRYTYIQPFQIELEQKKSNGNLEKETKHSHASAAHLSDIRIGNVDWCICGFCKKEVREIDCF